MGGWEAGGENQPGCPVSALPESKTRKGFPSPKVLRLALLTGLCRPRIRMSPDLVPGVLSLSPLPWTHAREVGLPRLFCSSIGSFLAGSFSASWGRPSQAPLCLLTKCCSEPAVQPLGWVGPSPHGAQAPTGLPLGCDSDFTETGAAACAHPLKTSLWTTGKPRGPLRHPSSPQSTQGVGGDAGAGLFSLSLFFLKSGVCLCMWFFFFILQRKPFECSLGKNMYFTRTVIVLPKMKYVIFS